MLTLLAAADCVFELYRDLLLLVIKAKAWSIKHPGFDDVVHDESSSKHSLSRTHVRPPLELSSLFVGHAGFLGCPFHRWGRRLVVAVYRSLNEFSNSTKLGHYLIVGRLFVLSASLEDDLIQFLYLHRVFLRLLSQGYDL